MDDEQSEAWPATDWEEPASHDDTSNNEAPEEAPTITADADDVPADSETEEAVEQEASETLATAAAAQTGESWTLPIRAAPILALQGEEVVEFPLSQHRSGLESTSLIMDDKLMRIVEARYDPDGVRRLNVRMALVKEHISGYSHTHLDLFQKLQTVWWGAIGFGLVMATGFAQSLLALGG